MKKKEKKTYTGKTSSQEQLQERQLDDCFFASNSASACDCTGTVVRGPQSDGVANAYDEVYHYQPPTPGKKGEQ